MDRLRWSCRRGLLELDLVLQRFLREEYPLLGDEQKQTFRRLLGLPVDRGRSCRRQLRRQGPHENTRVEPSSTVGHGTREELNFQQFPEVLDRGDVDGGHSVAVARFRTYSRHLVEAPRHQ